MKIAVASNDKIHVTGHIGRCKGFSIFSIEENKIIAKEYRENNWTNHMQNHGHNHDEVHTHGHSSLINGLSDCNALIFNHGGLRLIEDLKANNIEPILTNEEIAEEAVIKYLKGDLIIANENICQGHHH